MTAVRVSLADLWRDEAWTGSWTESPESSSAASVILAITYAIGAASAYAARDRAPRNA